MARKQFGTYFKGFISLWDHCFPFCMHKCVLHGFHFIDNQVWKELVVCKSNRWRVLWDITVRQVQHPRHSILARLVLGPTEQISKRRRNVHHVPEDGSVWKALLHQLLNVSLDIGAQKVCHNVNPLYTSSKITD